MTGGRKDILYPLHTYTLPWTLVPGVGERGRGGGERVEGEGVPVFRCWQWKQATLSPPFQEELRIRIRINTLQEPFLGYRCNGNGRAFAPWFQAFTPCTAGDRFRYRPFQTAEQNVFAPVYQYYHPLTDRSGRLIPMPVGFACWKSKQNKDY